MVLNIVNAFCFFRRRNSLSQSNSLLIVIDGRQGREAMFCSFECKYIDNMQGYVAHGCSKRSEATLSTRYYSPGCKYRQSYRWESDLYLPTVTTPSTTEPSFVFQNREIQFPKLPKFKSNKEKFEF